MPAAVVVQKDVGGLVRAYQERTELYRSQNREVRLHECRSACTLALSLPNVCVYPSSTLKFHQAYNDITKEVDYGVTSELWSAYPQGVREKLGTLTRKYKVLRGSELIALGVRNCNAPAPQPKIMIARATPAPAAQGGGEFLKGVQSAVETLFGAGAKVHAAPAASRRPAPAKPAEPAQPSTLEASVSAPLPPPRPPMIGAVPTPQPPVPKGTPAFLTPMAGSAPILEPRFIPLVVARRRLAELGFAFVGR
ncbi:MAG: hypothetical protein H6872_03075 [Methylobacteriaceae bacterium]|nr:hypothetical protein [Methylobacteriaceae bacterium]